MKKAYLFTCIAVLALMCLMLWNENRRLSQAQLSMAAKMLVQEMGPVALGYSQAYGPDAWNAIPERRRKFHAQLLAKQIIMIGWARDHLQANDQAALHEIEPSLRNILRYAAKFEDATKGENPFLGVAKGSYFPNHPLNRMPDTAAVYYSALIEEGRNIQRGYEKVAVRGAD